MWIKICGNTNLEDAQLAAELGADALGFIFAASKRQMTAAQVAAIARELPENVERVGVFDSRNPDLIANAAQVAGLTSVQLHGGFDAELLEHLNEILVDGQKIIQTLQWPLDDPSSAARIADELRQLEALDITDKVLIDSKIGSVSGGTGIAFDWAAARTLFASAPRGLHLIVAGGLKPDNVARAIAELAPWGVDVSSGVEASVGRKDPTRMAQLIQNARTEAAPTPGVPSV
jgi:phosphoribosylanthranilate isomerase